MTNALGVDVSQHEGRVNWTVGIDNGVTFGACRATVSWAYVDTTFSQNWRSLRELSLPRIAYHVLYPGENVQRQAAHFLSTIGTDREGAIPALDCELDHNQSKSRITQAIIEWLQTVEAGWTKPIIYSRANWINEHTNNGSWRRNYDWWLAQYLLDRSKEHPGPPTLPAGVTDWLIHQTSDKKEPWPAFAPNAGDIDLDRWNGDAETMRAYFGIVQQPERGTLLQWANELDKWARTQGYDGIMPPKDEAQP